MFLPIKIPPTSSMTFFMSLNKSGANLSFPTNWYPASPTTKAKNFLLPAINLLNALSWRIS